MPHVVFGSCFFLYSHFLCLFVCVCLRLCLLFLFFVCCSCSLFFLFGGLFCSPNGCVHNGEKTPVKTVKKTGCIDLYWGVIVFFFLIVLGGWGNVVAWSFYMLMTPLLSQPHLLLKVPILPKPQSESRNHVVGFMKRGKWSKHQIGVFALQDRN